MWNFRALAQHSTSAYIIQDWNMYLAPFGWKIQQMAYSVASCAISPSSGRA